MTGMEQPADLKNWRVVLGLTQAEAARLNGLCTKQWNRIEKGKVPLSLTLWQSCLWVGSRMPL